MGAFDWIQRSRELRRELAVLESGIASEEEPNDAYIAGLRRELSGWVQVLEHAHELGDKHEILFGSGLDGAPLRSPKSGLEMAADAEETIAAIEAEIARVSSG
jgi:hypothetical protein